MTPCSPFASPSHPRSGHDLAENVLHHGGLAPEPKTFLSLITGSFATPAAENPTVAMIEAAYEHHHIDARYINCDVAQEALGDAVRGARAMGRSLVLATRLTRTRLLYDKLPSNIGRRS